MAIFRISKFSHRIHAYIVLANGFDTHCDAASLFPVQSYGILATEHKKFFDAVHFFCNVLYGLIIQLLVWQSANGVTFSTPSRLKRKSPRGFVCLRLSANLTVKSPFVCMRASVCYQSNILPYLSCQRCVPAASRTFSRKTDITNLH